MKAIKLTLMILFICKICLAQQPDTFLNIEESLAVRKADINTKVRNLYQQHYNKNNTPWLQANLDFYMAHINLIEGNTDKCLEFLNNAVNKGFDDYLAIYQEPLFKKLNTDTKFLKIYNNIKISPADKKELMWLKQEMLNVYNDTNMMIIENTNRKDGDKTIIPQSQIPVRKTKSISVKKYRILLKALQQRQENLVYQSDIARQNHLISMNIIDNMGTTDSYQLQLKIQEKNKSKMDALARAKNRRQNIKNRQLIINNTTSTIPEKCPPLGKNELKNWLEKYQTFVKMQKNVKENKASQEIEKNNTRKISPFDNPLHNTRKGETAEFLQNFIVNGHLHESRITFEVTSVDKSQINYKQTTKVNGMQDQTVYTRIEVKSSLKEQLIELLGKSGKVKVISYSSKTGSAFCGKQYIKVTNIAIEFYWNLNNTQFFVQAKFPISKKAPLFGYCGFEMSMNSGTILLNQTLEKYKSGDGPSPYELTQKTNQKEDKAEENYKNPFLFAKIGDTGSYKQTLKIYGKIQQEFILTCTVIEVTKNHVTIKEVGTEMQIVKKQIAKDFKQQLIQDFSTQGPVNLISYKTKQGEYNYKGEVKKVTIIDMEWHWTINQKLTHWQATIYASNELGSLGYYELFLRTKDSSVIIHQKLQTYSN